MQKLEGKLDEKKWMVLGKKVASIMAFSSLAKKKKNLESGLGFELEEDHHEVFLLKEDINAKKF
ncbi:hypothetical protein EF849_22925 [Aeromonas jandaei]|nr:hypothetical protein [Aeromonas jandaei]